MKNDCYTLHKKTIAFSIFFSLTLSSGTLFAERTEKMVEHQFKAGEIISADIFNEIVSSINNGFKGFTSASELLGNWSCITTQTVNTASCLTLSRYQRDQNGISVSATQIIRFKDDSDGTFSYESEFKLENCMSVGEYLWDAPQTAPYDIMNGKLLRGLPERSSSSYSYSVINNLQKISDSKFTRVSHFNSKFAA
jgi:hypothetical protein